MKGKFEKVYIKPQIMVALMFGSGFIIGMTLAFCFGKNSIEAEAEWLDSIMLYLRYGTVYYNDLMFYILKKRISTLFIFLLICLTGYAVHILLTGVAVFGLFSGYMITKYIILKGIVGSVFFAVSLFPHYLCYVYGYLKLLDFMRNKHIAKININHSGQYKEAFKWKKALPVVVVIIGLLLECYVNPFFVKIFLKIFM